MLKPGSPAPALSLAALGETVDLLGVVVAKMSSLPRADDEADWAEHVAFFDRVSNGLVP